MTDEQLEENVMAGARQFGLSDNEELAIFHATQMAVSELMNDLGNNVEASGLITADRWMIIQAAAFYSLTSFIDKTMKEAGL